MTRTLIPRPAPTEYFEYYDRYISQVTEEDVLNVLTRQREQTSALIGHLTDAEAEFRYADGKWSIKEVIGHVSDAERVFTYRALRFARGDATPLPGFDENEFVRGANFGRRTLADLLAEFRAVRQATLAFFGSLDDEELQRKGIASEHEITVRAIAWIIAGHARHHTELLAERYLKGLERAAAPA